MMGPASSQEDHNFVKMFTKVLALDPKPGIFCVRENKLTFMYNLYSSKYSQLTHAPSERIGYMTSSI